MRRAVLTGLVLPGAASVALHAGAQQVQIEPSVDARVVVSDNVGFNRPSLAQQDTVFNLYSQVQVGARGPRYRLGGSFGIVAVENVDTPTPRRLLPRVNFNLNSEVVERTFFFDADAGVISTREDPFGARAEPSVTYDALGSLEYRFGVHPRIERQLSTDNKILIRSDHTWIRTDSADTVTATQPDAHYQDSAAVFERAAVPMGYKFEARRQKEVNDSIGAVGTIIDSIRASTNYAFSPGVTAGATLGREHNIYSSSDDVDTIRGVNMALVTGGRTELRASVERRFFGTGWEASIRTRTPFMAFSLTTARQPILASTILGVIPAGGDIAALLDSILASRYSNAAERAAVIRDLISRQGLGGATNKPLEIRSQSAQLVQSTTASAAYLGRRNAVFVNAFGSKSSQLTRDNLRALALASGSVNQQGYSVLLSRRLTPNSTLNFGVTQTKTTGTRDTGEQENSVDRSLSLAWTHMITPRTTVQGGLLWHVLDTNSTIVPSAKETRGYAGMSHRF